MTNIIKKIREDKQEYRRQMEKVKALPEGYQFVFEKMQGYMWGFAGGDGLDMLKTQYELIALFEESAAEGKHVLDVTGKDVAAFCEELIRGNRQWMDGKRKRLNHALQQAAQANEDT